MGYKQALFLGGSVLVLAACADSVAPTPTMTRSGDNSAVLNGTGPQLGPSVPQPTVTVECRGVWYVSSGRTEAGSDSSCVVEIQ